MLLLDALDETVIGATTEIAEDSYRQVSDAITQITTRYHRSLIVVTARKAGYQQRASLPGFTELEVLDFSSQDIRQFVNRWSAGYADPKKRANEQIDPILQWNITLALSVLGEHSIASDLLRLLVNEQIESSIRESYSHVLGPMGERPGGAEVLQRLSDMLKDSYIGIDTVDKLDKLGERSVVPELLPLLSNSKMLINLRERIAEALGNLADDVATITDHGKEKYSVIR